MVLAFSTVTCPMSASRSAWSLGTSQIQSSPPVRSSAIWVFISLMVRKRMLPMAGLPFGLPSK